MSKTGQVWLKLMPALKVQALQEWSMQERSNPKELDQWVWLHWQGAVLPTEEAQEARRV